MDPATFLAKASAIHKNKYDYSKADLSQPIITIICPEHGEFQQKVSVHINDKCGCRECGRKYRYKKNKKEEFLKKAKLIHNNKYDYSKSDYKDSHTKIIIICPIHGEFPQFPYAHINQKQGCPKCGLINRRLPHKKTTQQFIAQAQKKWNYNYSQTQYTDKYTKIRFECPKHGVIEQLPYLHLKHGCQYCNGRGISRHSLVSFINIANAIHSNRYDYSKTNFVRMSDKITIICKEHGEFSQRAGNHIHLKNGCPKCAANILISSAQQEMSDFIKEHYGLELLDNCREILDGKEIDIYLPDLKLGFEYHGIYWHLETVVGRKYHYNKWKLANERGVRLIQINSDEWAHKKDIVKSKIINLLGRSKRIFARKTEIVKVDKHDKNEFLTTNHIQGGDGAKIAFGLKYNNELVCLMTFDKSRFNKKYKYELVRFCCKNFFTVVGGASKLLKHFRNLHPGSIVSYADKRYSSGNLYHQLGFILDGETKPSFSYFNIKNNTLHSRLSFQKHKLASSDPNLTEYEIMQLRGFDRIWDAGQWRFVLS